MSRDQEGPSVARLQAAVDAQEIRDLGYRFADACNRQDPDAFRGLWTAQPQWRPNEFVEATQGLDAVVALLVELLAQWDFFVQMPYAPVVTLDGERASSRWTVTEHGNSAARRVGYFNYGLYDDVVVRTPGGWRYQSRDYLHLYMDEAPAAGAAVAHDAT